MSQTYLPDGYVVQAKAVELPDFATRFVNLASADFGAEVLSCSDEWFAAANRMLQTAPPVFVVGKFDDHGKWMDGWETRRKRYEGYDHAIVKLGLPGVIKGVDIDTSHFTGNFPPAASLDACRCTGVPDESTEWVTLVEAVSLQGDSHRFVEVDDEREWTHMRLNTYPDGGVARLRVYGLPKVDWDALPKDEVYETSAVANGGRIVAVSNAHYGVPFRLNMPGRGINMGDGWETARRRVPGNEWCIIELGTKTLIEKIEVDTAHFKGNYPDTISIQAADVTFGTDESLVTQSMFWQTLLPQIKTEMDKQHFYTQADFNDLGAVTHIKLNIHPDGGVSRLRVWGKPVR
ncbi:allantoicase [Neisseria sp. S1]|uniref:allantoicase n=1 Tax=Neisseria sp. S1 TaxID=3318354 RepID=UPI003A896152